MATNNQNKTYLGDSVYAVYEGHGCVMLCVYNGMDQLPTENIFIEPDVLKALNEFVERMVSNEAKP